MAGNAPGSAWPRSRAALVGLGLGALFLACRAAPPGAPATPSNIAELRLAGPPARIVSLAPNLTELLFALGAGPRVVGVTRYCDEPPAARALPKVGGIIDPDFESVLRLAPDLVVVVRNGGPAAFARRLSATGRAVYWSDVATVADVHRTARELGALIGRPAAAEALVRRLQAELAAVAAQVRGRPRPRVLVLVGHQPLIVVARGFVAELLDRAGAENAVLPGPVDYPAWSIEQVVRAAPDVLLDLSMGTEAAWAPRAVDAAWQSIPAVATGRVYALPADLLLRPGPRLGAALRLLAERLHPGLAAAGSADSAAAGVPEARR